MTVRVDPIRRACEIIQTQPEAPHTLETLARRVGLSRFHFQRAFTRAVGVSPKAFLQAVRVGHVKTALRSGAPVAAALYAAGYGSSSRLYEQAGATFGMTPRAYKRGAPGMAISFTIVRSPLGRLLLAATANGVCRVTLGDHDGALEQALREEFSGASIRRDDRLLSPAARAVIDYVSGRSPHIALPLDVRATAFQWRVWRELQAIPYGETRTYQQIARAMGHPRATRAVARACATNPVALIVPCHRVIRTDGSLGGYRWGLKRKRALLRMEGAG